MQKEDILFESTLVEYKVIQNNKIPLSKRQLTTSLKLVSITPGAIPLTRTPNGPHSVANAFTIPNIAVFEIEYAPMA